MGNNGWLCRTPMREVSRKPAGVKWCFKCRADRRHDWIVLATVEPSYYDPTVRFDCRQCHQDHTLFPGVVREWDYP